AVPSASVPAAAEPPLTLRSRSTSQLVTSTPTSAVSSRSSNSSSVSSSIARPNRLPVNQERLLVSRSLSFAKKPLPFRALESATMSLGAGGEAGKVREIIRPPLHNGMSFYPPVAPRHRRSAERDERAKSAGHRADHRRRVARAAFTLPEPPGPASDPRPRPRDGFQLARADRARRVLRRPFRRHGLP